jgi:DNA polymerase-3 subunit alpha
MPDIDIDFSVRGRERVMQYVVEKYGRESVAQIITFGKMLPRAATKDAARVLGHDYGVGDRLAKLIPDPEQGRSPSFDDCLAEGSDLRKAYDEDATAKQIIDVAAASRGSSATTRSTPRRSSSPGCRSRTWCRSSSRTRVRRTPRADKVYKMVTQFSMKPSSSSACSRWTSSGGATSTSSRTRWTSSSAPRAPGRTWPTCPWTTRPPTRCWPGATRSASSSSSPRACRAPCARSSHGVRRPRRARGAVPAGRDGPDPHVRARQAQSRARLGPDERLEPMIGGTYGVILYQEQAMQISKALAGFSAGKADDLRKAIGKKKADKMAELKPEFVAGCRANGVTEEVIDWLWATNEASANYSFNKSHAACYALISYRTAWLKANYPAEYMAALISSVMSTKDKVPFFVNQAESMGIEILPPDVNESDHEFMVVEGNIRFGLDAVKGVGHSAVEAIKEARESGGPFTSIWDFCERVDCRLVNRRAVESLIRCGAFGSTADRARASSKCSKRHRARAEDPAGRADRPGLDLRPLRRGPDPAQAAAGNGRPLHPPVPIDEFDRQTVLAMEKESIGLFISEHPLKRVREALRLKGDCLCQEVAERKNGEWVKVGGIIASPRRFKTRSGSTMLRAVLDDLDAQVNLVVFEKVLEARAAVLEPDSIVLVRGTVEHGDNGEISIKVADLEGFDASDADIEKARELRSRRRRRLLRCVWSSTRRSCPRP